MKKWKTTTFTIQKKRLYITVLEMRDHILMDRNAIYLCTNKSSKKTAHYLAVLCV